MYSLTVLEARRLKSRCWQGHALSEGCTEGSQVTSSRLSCWRAFLRIWSHRSINHCLHCHMSVFPLHFSTFPSGMASSLNSICQIIYFQNGVTSPGTRTWEDFNKSFLGNINTTHNRPSEVRTIIKRNKEQLCRWQEGWKHSL